MAVIIYYKDRKLGVSYLEMVNEKFLKDKDDELKPEFSFQYSSDYGQLNNFFSKEEIKKMLRQNNRKYNSKKVTDIITHNELSSAISNSTGMGIEKAKRDAMFVLDIFGYDDRVIDNVLDRDDRQLFYILEEEGILDTEREENILYDGRTWRTHYWKINKDVVWNYLELGKNNKENKKPTYNKDVFSYDEVDEDVWSSRKFPEEEKTFSYDAKNIEKEIKKAQN